MTKVKIPGSKTIPRPQLDEGGGYSEIESQLEISLADACCIALVTIRRLNEGGNKNGMFTLDEIHQMATMYKSFEGISKSLLKSALNLLSERYGLIMCGGAAKNYEIIAAPTLWG